jgi:hypothetical protein
MAGKTREQVQKAYHEINQKHSKIFQRYNSPFYLGDTEQYRHTQMKWLERFAGFIQALRWVLDENEELPEQYNAIPDI